MARPVRWEKPKGGKAPAAQSRGSFSRTTTLRPRTTTAMRTTAPRSRRGARPARQESAQRYNRKRRRACLCGGDPEEAGTSMAMRAEVATMRGRNTMRFSAPTREPPGGRPSRGAKLKGRGCTRQQDARNENRLGGTGAAKKAPSEQGATKAAGLGAANARWSRASGACGASVAGRRRAAAVSGKGGNLKKRTTKELSIFSDCRSA